MIPGIVITDYDIILILKFISNLKSVCTVVELIQKS
jgi:hypothetical protein